MYNRAIQLVVHSNILPMEKFGRRHLLTLSLPKVRTEVEAVFKTYKLFIYRDIHYITGVRGGVVVKALRYKTAGHGFDS